VDDPVLVAVGVREEVDVPVLDAVADLVRVDVAVADDVVVDDKELVGVLVRVLVPVAVCESVDVVVRVRVKVAVADEISEACASEVQKSLPFVCSFEISRYCSSKHTIDKSVLQCLEDQLDKGSPMDTECRDSVGATRSVLIKMKTQNVALVNRRTGEIIRGPLSYVSQSIYIGLYCLGFFILGVLLYSFWVRDDETGLLKSIQKTLRELRVAGRSKGQMRVSTMEMKDGFNRSL
jgi:hypothetical protein